MSQLTEANNPQTGATARATRQINREQVNKEKIKSRGLLLTQAEIIHRLQLIATNQNMSVTMVSDGSVRDSTYRGTWAWSLVMERRCKPILAGASSICK